MKGNEARAAFAMPAFVLAGLLAAYLVLGLVGHDPWKPDDATHFGIVYSMLQAGSWLPSLAGEPLPTAPPLYYWVAALVGRAAGVALPLDDAVRLTTGVFAALFLWGMARLADLWYGASARALAALIAIGCLGLLLHIHETLPRVGLLAALAFALYGLAVLPKNPGRGGLIAGISAGAGFLIEGVLAPMLLVPLFLALPLLGAAWRGRGALLGLALALAVGLALGALWPVLLAALGETQPRHWALAIAPRTADAAETARRLWGYLTLLTWFAWPAAPLALWTLWMKRRALQSPEIALPAAALLIFLPVLATQAEPRTLPALPLLVPLVALAVPAATSLRRGAANAFDWFGMMTFTVAGALAWFAWIAALTGHPARTARNISKLAPGFTMPVLPLAITVAAALTAAWIWIIVSTPRSPARSTVIWAAGMTFVWGLATTLLLPWVDYTKSYRDLSASLKAALPPGQTCVLRRGLGQAQRASFDYFAGIRTVPERSAVSARCRLLLIQATGRPPVIEAPDGWRQIWEDRRRSDRTELFRLYLRE